MPKLVISVPTAELRITDEATASAIKTKFKLTDEDYDGMAMAELGARLAGAIKRAIESKKLPAKPTVEQATKFLSEWGGLGGRKGNPVTRYQTLSKSDKATEKEIAQAREEAVNYLMNEGKADSA